MKKTISIGIIATILVLVAGAYVLRTTPGQVTVPNDTDTSDTTADVRIIAFGDSLTAGFGLPLAESYPNQLQALLRDRGYSVEVVNAGVSGETTAGARERAGFIRGQSADIVLLGIGGNDALRALPLSETEANIRHILTILTEGDNPPQVLMLQIQAPQNAGLEFKESFDALYPALAREFNILLVPFVVLEVVRNPAYMLPDGIHPNSAGYEFLVREYVAPAVEEVLTEQDSI